MSGMICMSLAQAYDNERKSQKELTERNMAKAKSRIKFLERLIGKAYEDMLAETITKKMFDSLIERYKKEFEDLLKEIKEAERQLAATDDENGNAKKWIDLIKEYADISERDAETLNRLIKQIIVHERITEDGTRNITVEIHYNFRPMDESQKHNLSYMANKAHSDAKAM